VTDKQPHAIRLVSVFVLVANILLFAFEFFFGNVASIFLLVVIVMSIAAVSTRQWEWVHWIGIVVTPASMMGLSSDGFSSYWVDEYLFGGYYRSAALSSSADMWSSRTCS